MSFQVRRDRNNGGDRSRNNSQQTWIPRNSSSTSVVVPNEPTLFPNTDRNSESRDAAVAASHPPYLQRQLNGSAPPPYNHQQRSNNIGPRPHNRQRRNDAAGTLPVNHQHQRSDYIGPPPPNQQRRNDAAGILPENQHQRGPPPPSRQRRNNVSGTLPDNRQRVSSRTRPVYQGKRVAKEEDIVVMTDPNLPQLVQELQEKLVKSSIECMICYDKVGRSANIWSCSSCYSIFHMNCIKRWARAPTSIDLLAEKNQGDNWRCPGCQSVQLTSSKEISYRCFCGKRKDPPSDPYLTPHSCGEPCGKPLEKEFAAAEITKEDLCPHVCVLQCHPGPCPPCKAFAPPRSCPCGKKMVTTRCSERRSVLVCGQPCDKLLNCGRHQCERTCHVGPCDPCQVLVNATCFCKKKMETVICGDMNVKGELKAEDGVYSCSFNCGKPLGCGNHFCSDVCHPGPCGDCDLLPSRVKTCYCGKTRLEEQIRQSCLDPIPSCSSVCRKLLPCKLHTCNEVCHAGDCPPCLVQVNEKCQCGSTSRAVECYITTSSETEKFVCAKPCGRKKNCGRHRCSQRCCPLMNGKKNDRSGDWDPHVCQIPCGKKLRCGQHSCESLCHSGHCPPCLEMIFTDLTCACGRTSIPPPLPCGTPVPSCQHPCSIPQPCGHSATHGCHFGDCPPCSAPVEKKCVGGHVVLRNIPCGLKDIRCNKICGKTRRCGMHACARSCHPEPCDSYNESEAGMRVTCGQKCGAPRRDCRHTCAALCHPSAPCPDLRCEVPVTITCSCGRISATVPCDAGGRSANSSNVFSAAYDEASILQKLPAPLQPVESSGNRIPLGQRKLSCDDECAKLERKRVLQDAFDITPPNLEALHFSESSAMTEIISDLYRRDPKWVLAVEERCKFLVLGKARGSTSALKVHVFCPMQKDKRDTVRLIAERWKLGVSNAGWEPKRFTVVHVTAKSKPPTRIIGARGGAISIGGPHPPSFDPLVDMDPGLVVALLDLPREANISALVLRFGGECELVWLNDKNALAVFHDHARAATAMRRLDHGSVYYGAVVVQTGGQSSSHSNAWGKLPGGSAWDVHKGNPWKKAVIQETVIQESDDSWGAEDSPIGGSSRDIQASALRSAKSNNPIATSVNRWSVLEPEKASSTSSLEPITQPQIEESSSSKAADKQPVEGSGEEVVDDWEKVCD
ncbi:PREDICTED: NF-X1-type zinc finger protein NFXL1 isoform X2 [Camelina sativa]|uniref:NF-X1-type zinc finger protein NFXL1 isoform X2 n=1 Tax=Camelina sativa TaxID=90675 RepID=A0ABM0WTD3_CAMSA|nr:PREDICTED: NF-X1-type zinc finger protein NFXL1 isoform X2 [Camelina sativa]